MVRFEKIPRKQQGYQNPKDPVIPHRATQITWDDYVYYDYIIGMDDWNMRNLHKMLKNDPEGKVYKLLRFADREDDIADPWYTGNFDVTYDDVLEGCTALLAYVLSRKNV